MLNLIRSPYWCNGKCGNGEVCEHIMFVHGYCLEPKLRIKAIDNLVRMEKYVLINEKK